MPSLRSILLTSSIAALSSAFTPPKDNTWGALLLPDLKNSVTQGKPFTVKWDPSGHKTDGVTVSLVLCHGNTASCDVSDSAIVEKVPADKKEYVWNVPCNLAPGKQLTDTGYGMLVIVDGTGEFQYSTQFSVIENKDCQNGGNGDSKSSSTTEAPKSSSTSSSTTSSHAKTSKSTSSTTSSATPTSSGSSNSDEATSTTSESSTATIPSVVTMTTSLVQNFNSAGRLGTGMLASLLMSGLVTLLVM